MPSVLFGFTLIHLGARDGSSSQPLLGIVLAASHGDPHPLGHGIDAPHQPDRDEQQGMFEAKHNSHHIPTDMCARVMSCVCI